MMDVDQENVVADSFNLWQRGKPRYTWGESVFPNKYVILRDGEWHMSIHMNADMPNEQRQECLGKLVNGLNQAGK